MNHEEREILWGYRPLITHNRKRNRIPATEQPENRSAHRALPVQMPPIQRTLARRDDTPIFKAKVEALIERFKPFAARTRERDRKWMR